MTGRRDQGIGLQRERGPDPCPIGCWPPPGCGSSRAGHHTIRPHESREGRQGYAAQEETGVPRDPVRPHSKVTEETLAVLETTKVSHIPARACPGKPHMIMYVPALLATNVNVCGWFELRGAPPGPG